MARQYYETKLTAVRNIRLEIVRKVNDVQVYCIAREKSRRGTEKKEYSGYYNINELTKIINP